MISVFAAGSGIAFAEHRTYSVPWAHMDLTVEDDGTLHVTETIHYHFSGTYNGVYRNIPLKKGQTLENLGVNVSGAYYTYQVTDDSYGKHVKVFLYSDPFKTNPISNRDVDVIYNYDFLGAVKFYNDVAELQYKLWGDGWGLPVGKLDATVHLKSKNGVEYWLNPPYLSESTSWKGSTFTLTSKQIPKLAWFEVRMVIPKDQFSSFQNGQIINQNGLKTIEGIQSNYANWVHFEEILYQILPFLMILSMLYPLRIIYKSRGRNIMENSSEWEGTLPENDSPAVVNAICCKGISKKVGEPDINGFTATILDLVRRRYIIVANSPNELQVRINTKKESKHLKNFERNVLDFFNDFTLENTVHIDEMNEKLEKSHFKKRYSHWRKNVIKEVSSGKLDPLFKETNDKGLYIYGFAALLLSALIMVWSFKSSVPGAVYSVYAALPVIVMAVISLIMTSRISGEWTDYGREYLSKWRVFKNHAKTSNVNEDSQDVFNDYLIYGTALGVGENAFKSMQKKFPEESLLKSSVFLFHSSPEFRYLKGTMVSFIGLYGPIGTYLYSDNWGGSGGFGGGGAGGAGGGAGGGGGGAF